MHNVRFIFGEQRGVAARQIEPLVLVPARAAQLAVRDELLVLAVDPGHPQVVEGTEGLTVGLERRLARVRAGILAAGGTRGGGRSSA